MKSPTRASKINNPCVKGDFLHGMQIRISTDGMISRLTSSRLEVLLRQLYTRWCPCHRSTLRGTPVASSRWSLVSSTHRPRPPSRLVLPHLYKRAVPPDLSSETLGCWVARGPAHNALSGFLPYPTCHMHLHAARTPCCT